MTRRALRLTLVGTSPLLMHAGSLLDPIHPITLELDAYHEKAAKSAADHRRIADLEFAGGLWHDDGGRPCLPARTLQAVVREAAERRGAPRCIRTAILVEADAPLDYDGPASLQGLAQDQSYRLRSAVTFDGGRRMCTRPYFARWAATIAVSYDSGAVDRADLIDLMIMAGDDIGIGAGRPRFGRFSVAPIAD